MPSKHMPPRLKKVFAKNMTEVIRVFPVSYTHLEAPAKKTVTKKVTEKAATVKKTAVRKTSSRKTVSLNTEVYVQWLGKEVYERDIIENIKKVWTEEMGKKESELVDLKIYIKPEDNGAHYVINGDITGFIEL